MSQQATSGNEGTAPGNPVVVVKHVQNPKSYNGKSSWKQYKKYFTRVASVNGWTNYSDKLQHLLLALDGPAAEVATEIDDQSPNAYDEVWQALARRFGSVDENRENMRRFDQRRQGPSESIAEYEQALRTLHFEAWPNATQAQKDSDLKRRFEEGLSSQEMSSYLRLHAGQDTFVDTVKKARQFETLTQKTVKTATTDTVTISTVQLGSVGDVLDSIRTIVKEELGHKHGRSQFEGGRQTFSPVPRRMGAPALPTATVDGRRTQGWPPDGCPFDSGTPVPRFCRRQRCSQFGGGRGCAVGPGCPVVSGPAENAFVPPPRSFGRCRSVPPGSRRAGGSGCWECGAYGCHSDLHRDRPLSGGTHFPWQSPPCPPPARPGGWQPPQGPQPTGRGGNVTQGASMPPSQGGTSLNGRRSSWTGDRAPPGRPASR